MVHHPASSSPARDCVCVSRRLYRYATACSALAWLLGSVAPACAQNKYWTIGAGGAFASPANWSNTPAGPGGATPPGPAETANFTLANTYTVNFSANVQNAGLNITNGNVTLGLNSFSYLITGSTGTQIGSVATQTGRLTVRDGTLSADSNGDDFSIGSVAGATGFLTVAPTGQLGSVGGDPDLIVGDAGTGTLTVQASGRADVSALTAGQVAGATGTVLVGGPNAILDATGTVSIGVAGTGTLSVEDSGIMTSAVAVVVGSQLGGDGTVTISDTNSRWTQSGAFTLGNAGNGELTVQAAATMSTAGAVIVGNASTGTGTAVVKDTDSLWSMANSLTIGASGLGSLTATDGGRISTTGQTTLGNNSAGKGTLFVTGHGTRWTSGAITVGNAGDGTLTIADAAVVDSTGNVILGNATAGIGRATVRDPGTIWTINGGLTASILGNSVLTVENGAELNINGAFAVVDPVGLPSAAFNFHGGTINANSFFRHAVTGFNWTDGLLRINGGSFNNNGANLTVNGGDADDLPTLRLASGATSVVANLPNLTIGSTRRGAVAVTGGSSFQTTTTSIGSVDGSDGSLLVEGLNSILSTTGDLGVGGTTTTAGGTGTINLGNGGIVSVGGTLRLWSFGNVNVDGGTLAFNAIALNGGRILFNSGTVRSLASFTADSAFLRAVLGSTKELGIGRRIDATDVTMTLTSGLTVNGGTVSGGVLTIGTNVVTTVQNNGNVDFTGGIVNPATARMYVTNSTVTAGATATFTNNGELHLDGITATVNANLVSNPGLITGSGRINSVVNNPLSGQIRIAPGQRLEILGTAGNTTNDGLIDVNGGTIEFGRPITNSTASPSSGLINGRNATLRFLGGLNNSGAMSFTEGFSNVFGDINVLNNLATPGRIVVTGGAQASFYDDVVNNGVIQVSASGTLASTAVFLGSLSGNAPVGGGHVFIEGDLRPGFSPGTMAFGGDLSFGSLSTLEIELAGTVPGTQYDRVTVAKTATINGTLEVTLLGGFMPAAGNAFQVLTASGGLNGTFTDTILPALAGGLTWNLAYSPQAVTLSVGGVLGDYNLDGTVDAADFVVWRKLRGTTTLTADGSGNGIVDQDDYQVWRANYGRTAPAAGAGTFVPSSAVVPEPATGITLSALASLLFLRRRDRRGPGLACDR